MIEFLEASGEKKKKNQMYRCLFSRHSSIEIWMHRPPSAGVSVLSVSHGNVIVDGFETEQRLWGSERLELYSANRANKGHHDFKISEGDSFLAERSTVPKTILRPLSPLPRRKCNSAIQAKTEK